MKKKILAFSICIAMLAIALIGGTMAYFTDKDEKTNVFTVGNIDIDLHEWKDYANNIPFKNIENIMPGMTYDKIVNVENKGRNDAYVQVTIVVPKDMTPTWKTGAYGTDGAKWDLSTTASDSNANRIYVFRYKEKLAPKTVTMNLLEKITLNADVTEITAADSYKVTVTAEAIQADSFATPEEAYATLEEAVVADRYEKVSNVDEMNTALQNNVGTNKKVVQMSNDVTSKNDIVMGAGAILDGNGYALNKTSDEAGGANAGISTVGGTIKNITVSGDTFNSKLFYAVYATNGINSDLVVDGVTLSGTYALNITDTSGVSKDYNLIVKNSKLNGWTSYAPVASAKFDNVTFGTASNQHNLKPHADTVLNNCVFNEEDGVFMIDAGKTVTITFNNCKVREKEITAENFRTLFDVEPEITQYGCTIVVNGVTVVLN